VHPEENLLHPFLISFPIHLFICLVLFFSVVTISPLFLVFMVLSLFISFFFLFFPVSRGGN
jgi:hypothetical protein